MSVWMARNPVSPFSLKFTYIHILAYWFWVSVTIASLNPKKKKRFWVSVTTFNPINDAIDFHSSSWSTSIGLWVYDAMNVNPLCPFDLAFSILVLLLGLTLLGLIDGPCSIICPHTPHPAPHIFLGRLRWKMPSSTPTFLFNHPHDTWWSGTVTGVPQAMMKTTPIPLVNILNSWPFGVFFLPSAY